VTRGWIVFLRCSLCLLIASLGFAASVSADGQKRVVVQSFRGPRASNARTHVVNALMEHDEVDLVTSPAFDGATGSALQDAAAEQSVSAIIQGKVTKKGKLLTVQVSVRDAANGNVVEEAKWTEKKQSLDDIEKDLWQRLGPAILRTEVPEKKKAPPPEPEQKREPERVEKPTPIKLEPEPEREPAEEKTSSIARGDSKEEPLHPALVVMVGPRLLWRSLDYDGATNLNGYSSYKGQSGTGPGFTFAGNVQWFPGAHVRRGWPSDIGLEVDADYSILKSTQGNKKLPTKAYEVAGSLLYRLPLDSFEPRFRVGYVRQVFDVQAPLSANLPAVAYQSIRLGVGTLINLVRSFNLDVGFGYLIVFSAGELGKKRYATDLSTYGWEVEGGATYRVQDAYGLRLGAAFRRYAFDTNKSENDRVILPKGGHDDYLRLTISFVYTLGGK
jgi:hypothetical protein